MITLIEEKNVFFTHLHASAYFEDDVTVRETLFIHNKNTIDFIRRLNTWIHILWGSMRTEYCEKELRARDTYNTYYHT